MRKKISFLILSTSRKPARQFSIPSSFLKIFLAVCVAGFGYGIYDYVRLKQSAVQDLHKERIIAGQAEEIVTQRQQIQNFAREITRLKQDLVELNGFEEKIRIIANLQQEESQEGLFGVGGSLPEDLDASLALSERHNSLLREMHTQIEQIQDASQRQADSFDALLEDLQDQQNLLACTPAIRPTRGWVTSKFGYRQSPFTGLREFHKGYDIATRKGTPIVATADGVVSFAGSKGLLGQVVTVDHGHGMVTRYGHVSKVIKKRGEKVKRGEKIALVGASGRTTGPHLHYEVLLNGVPVNPEKYILN
jgi:murein DD-endopeptidase MepM/ murein hydrolase activator NlpD